MIIYFSWIDKYMAELDDKMDVHRIEIDRLKSMHAFLLVSLIESGKLYQKG